MTGDKVLDYLNNGIDDGNGNIKHLKPREIIELFQVAAKLTAPSRVEIKEQEEGKGPINFSFEEPKKNR